MDRTADTAAIADLIHRYAWAIDTRDFDALDGYLADESELCVSDPGGPLEATTVARGVPEIVAFVTEAQERWSTTQRRHLMSNTVAEFPSDGRALARSYMAVIHTAPGGEASVVLAGYIADELVRDSGGAWRFTKRTVRRDG